MASRDEELYIQLFNNINNFAVENGIYFKENSNLEINTDFELASKKPLMKCSILQYIQRVFFILHNQYTEKSKTLVSAISVKITIISIY